MEKHDSAWDDPQLLKKKRVIGIISVALVLVVFIVLTILLRKPLLSAIRDKASFREWMQGTGFWKYPLMAGIMAMQVIIAFVPGEPIEIVAGYIFGAWGGLLLCLLGTALGSALIILVVRKLGMKFVTLFVAREQIENLRFFKNPKKRDATIFLLFLIPGTPKDILTYLSGLVPIHLGKYLLLTSVARIPSIITSTMGGNMLGKQEYKVAIIVFAVTAVLTGIAMLIYKVWQKREDAREKKVLDEAMLAQAEAQALIADGRLALSPEPADAINPGVPEASEDPVPPKTTRQAEAAPQEDKDDVPPQ